MTFDSKTFTVEQLISSGVLEIGDGYRAKNVELGDRGLPFVRVANINNGFDMVNVHRFPEENLHRIGNKLSQPGDVVFTSKGTVGRFAFVTPEIEQFVYSPQLCFWRSLAPDVLDARYLYFWMQGPEFLHQVDYLKAQTDMADYVSLRDQRNMTITLPPLSVQLEIAHTLTALEKRVFHLHDINETLESTAQAIFKSWFIDFDPVHAKATGHEPIGMDAETAALFPSKFEDSELGPIPKGWQIRSLDSFARYTNGLALQRFPPESETEFLPVIKIAQMRVGHTFDADRASRNLEPDYVVEDGDVLFSWSGSLLVKIWTGGRGALNQHLFKVTSDEVPKWFYYLATRHFLQEFRNIAASKATTMGHIRRRDLTEAKIAMPPVDLLPKMGALVETIVERRILNAINARTLSNLRDTLLPRLISGRLRIPEAEEIVEEAVS